VPSFIPFDAKLQLQLVREIIWQFLTHHSLSFASNGVKLGTLEVDSVENTAN